MNIHGVELDSMLNGDGLRVVLWVSGCSHHCYKCQNPQTWDEKSGHEFDVEDFRKMINGLDKDYISGLTLSGGDPMYESNRPNILNICKWFRDRYPNKTLWMYTGYRYEEIKNEPVLKYIDVLVDGEYKDEIRDLRCHWVGSPNQRVIDMKKTLKENKVVLIEDV